MKTIGARIGAGWIVVGLLIVAWAGGAVLAQRGGPGGPGGPDGMAPMRPGPPPVIMKAGAQGVFVLTGLTLTKYNSAMVEQKSLKLIDQSAKDEAAKPMPPKPIAMLVTGGTSEKVLVLFGNDFYSIDAATLSIVAKAKLPTVEPPKQEDGLEPGQPGMGPMPRPMAPQPPMLELSGQTLYVLRGNQIFSINVADGKVAGPATLPMPPAPTPPGEDQRG